MADHAGAVVLAFLAFAVAAWLTVSTVRALPADPPLVARRHVDPAANGPLARLIASAGPRGTERLVYTYERDARARLVAWLDARGHEDATRAPEAAEALGVAPVLVHVLRERRPRAWCRGEARARFGGPGWLFPFWFVFTWHGEKRDAALAEYADAFTRELEELVTGR